MTRQQPPGDDGRRSRGTGGFLAFAQGGDRDPRLPPGQRLTRKFPVLTAGDTPVIAEADWQLAIDGLVAAPFRLDMAGFKALGLETFTVDIHCVTRWSRLDTRWQGIGLSRLLAEAGGVTEGGGWLIAHGAGGYSANLKLDDDTLARCFVATHHDDMPLTAEHGGPARLVAPHRYFWKSTKWLTRLEVSPCDLKGYWERLGYHNRGDPWRQERYRGLDDRIR